LTVDNIDVEATIKKVQELLAQEPNLSPALRSTLDVLLLVVQLLINRLSLRIDINQLEFYIFRVWINCSLVKVCSKYVVGYDLASHASY